MNESKLMRAIFDNIAVAIVAADGDGNLIASNKAAESLHGVAPSNIPPDKWAEEYGIFLPDQVTPCPLDQLPLMRVLRGEAPEEVELYIRRPDGSGSVVSVTGCALLGDDGKWGGFVVFSDITARKLKDDALRTSEMLLREAQRIARLGSWEWDPAADVVNWTDETYSLLDLDSRLPPPSFEEHRSVYTPAAFASLEKAIARTLRDGTPYELDLEVRRSDGTSGWIIARGEPIRNAAGRIVRLRGTAMDISDRKRTERRIADLAERLSLATRAGRIGVWELDVPSDRLIWDESMYELYGKDAGEETGENNNLWVDSLHPADRDRMLREHSDALERDLPFDSEFRIVTPAGEIRHIRAQATVVRDGTGAPQRFIGTNWDITEIRTLAQALQAEKERLLQVIDDWIEAKAAADKANRAKSDFLAAMSHDLRTPMNAILGFGQLLEGKMFGPLNEKQEEFVEFILSSGRGLLKLIDQLLELSQIEAGKMKVSLEPVEIPPLMKVVAATLSQMTAKYDVRLDPGDFGAALPHVFADPVRLNHALTNIGSNAIKYNRRRGAAVFTYEVLDEDWVRITVTDNGIGIEEDRQAEIFQAFNRLGADHSGIEGTGIGLSITRQMVDLMGGRVGFVSRPGEGSSFWIDIPIYAEESGALARLAATHA